MFLEERHRAILDCLALNGRISNAEIQERFGVSYDSAKRDLRILEEKGLLKRTHGGAISIWRAGFGGGLAFTAEERVSAGKENDLQIAKQAVSVIQTGDVLYLTSGGIGLLMAQNLPQNLACTIVTTSLPIAEELRKREGITVFVTGGELDKNGSFYDSFTLDILNRLRFDKCFLTSACISVDFGISIQKTRDLGILSAVLGNSKKRYGLYPAEKIGFASILSVCPANQLDVLMTDWEAPEEYLSEFRELGMEVIVVNRPE